MTSVASYPPTNVSGVVTSWLPITSIWTVLAPCSTLVWEGFPPYLAVNDPGYGIYVDTSLSCLPPQATAWWDQAQISFTGTSFSLGPVVCPNIYTTAYTTVQDSSTFVACCPSAYSLLRLEQDGNIGECQSVVTSGQKFSIVIYVTTTVSNNIASAWFTTISTATAATAVSGVQINGWNFVPTTSTSSTSIRPPSTASSTVIASTPAKSTFATSTSSTPVTSVASPTPNHTSRNVGIGVGVSLGAIAILGISFLFWFIRRSRSASHANSRNQFDGQIPPGNVDVPGHWGAVQEIGPPKQPPQELGHGQDAPAQEIDSSSRFPEMAATHPVELD